MDTAFFVVSKIVGLFLRGETWIILLLLLGFWAQFRGAIRSGRVFHGLGITLLLGITAWPVGDVMLRPLELTYPIAPDLTDVDGIIVLGGAEQAGLAHRWGLPMVNEAGERFIAGAALAHEYPSAKLVFSGGSGSLRDLGKTQTLQADMAQQLFLSLSLAPDRIVLESTSRNTAENAENSYALIQPNEGETWVLVTSAFHMRRAVRSFHAAGWTNITPWPVDFRSVDPKVGVMWNLPRNLKLFNVALKETVGLIAYNLAGR